MTLAIDHRRTPERGAAPCCDAARVPSTRRGRRLDGLGPGTGERFNDPVTVEFRLLGDVGVRVDGCEVDTGHTRQRTILAALLVDLNKIVTADRLIDRVWGDRTPDHPRNALTAYLSKLRQQLAGVPAVRLTRGPLGYALSADPLSVDLFRFRDLAGRARAAARADEAAALFDEALDLWRGEPFAAIDTPWFESVRTAVEAERFALLLDRNDAVLRAGRHGELVAGLASAARAHPLDERIAGQLMLAQYRSGRQADALDTYQRTRARLRDELGADPGPTLREVHGQVLSGAAAAPVPPPDVAAPVVVVPAPAPVVTGRTESRAPAGNLPRRATSFVGRHGDIDRVAAALREGPLVTLTGFGGVGKSRLALETATRERERFADGAWLCELAAVDGAAVSHAVAAALGVRQRQDITIEETLVGYLRGRDVLLVVDNCEHVLDAVAALLDQVVRRCPDVVVLATSRAPLGVAGERILPVPPLPAQDSTVLFADRARAGRPAFRLEDEAEAVAEICGRLDGLPLAIELAAARMRAMSAAEVVRRLDEGRFVGSGSRTGPERHRTLAAAIDWSYRLLSEPEQALFARLSVFAGGFDLDAVHGVCGAPGADPDDTLDLLAGLVDKSMVSVLSGARRSRYRVLEPLRAYGGELLRAAGADAGRAHAEYYAGFAEQVASGLHGPDEGAWVERALPDYDNLRAAFERAVADGDGDLALRIVTSASELVHLRVGYESADWALRALDLVDDDHPLRPVAVGVAARAAWSRGEFAAAEVLARRGIGATLGRGVDRAAHPGDVLADTALYEGDAGTALRHYEGEVERARRDGDPIRLAWTLYLAAVCHAVLRDPESGRPVATESMDVADATGNPTARSMGRYALGLVLKKSDPERALVLLDEAAELSASVRNIWWHGVALMEAAATRAVHADPAAAALEFLAVLDHWDRLGDWTAEQWLNLRYIARLLARVGAFDDAVVLHHVLVAAGRPSPLDARRLADLAKALGPDRFAAAAREGDAAGAAATVGRARAALRRLAERRSGEGATT